MLSPRGLVIRDVQRFAYGETRSKFGLHAVGGIDTFCQRPAPLYTAEQAVTDHARLVRYLAWRFRRAGVVRPEVDDLCQEGFIGLIRAVRLYRAERGTKFSTYAGLAIRNAMRNAIKTAWIQEGRYLDTDQRGHRRGRRLTVVADYRREKDHDVPCDEVAVETLLESPEQRRRFNALFDRLNYYASDKLDREIIARLILGQSDTEIAAAFGLSKQAVGLRKMRLRNLLSQELRLGKPVRRQFRFKADPRSSR